MPGVGLILELQVDRGPRGPVRNAVRRMAGRGVRGREQPGQPRGLGRSVATFEESDSGTNTVTFDETGGAVLLWFTRAGDDGQVTVTEVRLER